MSLPGRPSSPKVRGKHDVLEQVVVGGGSNCEAWREQHGVRMLCHVSGKPVVWSVDFVPFHLQCQQLQLQKCCDTNETKHSRDMIHI